MSQRRRLALDLTPLRTSRDFRLVYFGAGVSAVGSYISYITIPYQIFKQTHSPLMVGLVGLCELLPLLLMAFVGGALADYLDRRRLVLGGELAFTLLTVTLLANILIAAPRLWVLYLVAGLTAAIDGIQRPALEAMMPRLIPAAQIPAASALNSLRHNTAAIAGPPLAGLLIASTNFAAVYAVDLATFAISLTCLAFVRPVPPPPAPERPSLRTVGAGLRYAVSRPELLGTYLIDLNAMFFGMPEALYPFVAERLGGPAILGLLYAAPSAGAVVVTLTSGWTGRVNRHGLAVVLAATGWGLAIIGFGVAEQVWLALLFLAIAGGSDMISGLFRGTIWNQTIPDHLRGRLAGIEMISYSAGPTLGAVESGVGARLVGVGGSIVWGGALCVAGTVAIAGWLHKFVRYDGRVGQASKQAADAEWAANTEQRLAA